MEKTAYPRFDLTIVDNHSTDGTREYLQKLGAEAVQNLQIILNEENKGFAGGNNVGIRSVNGDYVLLLNNDTIVTRGWITSLVKHMENDSKLGMCGSVTNSIGNEAKILVDYHDTDGIDEFAENYTWRHMSEEWKDPNVLASFCTLIKMDVMKKCGLLDESYIVGMFEDDDYAEAVRQAGYRLAIAEDSFVHHFEGASFKKLDDKNFKTIFESNKKIYEEKWKKEWKPPIRRPGLI
jgi:GT2 family glycosyltransferase